jgi:ribosomal protein S18 acetylase RimI-like enzyme
VIQDPSHELIALVRRTWPDDPPEAERKAAELARRRFGISLPPPFAPKVGPNGELPVRVASGADGTAIAAVKWRSWQVGYRGVIDDDFLDHRMEIHPTAGYWSERAHLPPSRRHRLLVLGRAGVVYGFCDGGPYRDDDLEAGVDPDRVGQVYSLYLDPTIYRLGQGSVLLAAMVDDLRQVGFADFRLWVADTNVKAQAFYRAQGRAHDGGTEVRTFPDLAVRELRFRLAAGDRGGRS